MNDELLIEFNGRSKKQDKFLSDFVHTAAGFLDEEKRIHANEMVTFLQEMVKNIYDHAEGKGKVKLTRIGRGIHFKVEDFGDKRHDFGQGLFLIQGMARDLKIIAFEINCSRGFTYTGIYPYKTRA